VYGEGGWGRVWEGSKKTVTVVCWGVGEREWERKRDVEGGPGKGDEKTRGRERGRVVDKERSERERKGWGS